MDVKRAVGVLTVLVTLLAPTFATTGSASATDRQTAVEGDLSGLDIPDAELRDLQVIAGQEDMSVVEAYQRYGWGQDFSDAVAAVAKAYPGDFVTSAMNQDGEVGGVVYFAGPTPEAALTYFDHFKVPIKIVENTGVPQGLMQQAVERIHYQSRELADGAQVFTEAEEESGTIVISVTTPTDGAQSVPVEDIQIAAQEKVAAMPEPFAERMTVRVRAEEGGGNTFNLGFFRGEG